MSTWEINLPKIAPVNIYVPRVNSSCLLCLWETLQVQQIGLTQAPFKLTSAQVPRACEILCVPFMNRIFISHSPLSLPNVSPGDLQSQTS